MENDQIKNVVILIHGVNVKNNKGWLLKFKNHFDNDIGFDNSWKAEHIYYGYLFFVFSIFPFIRHSKTKEVYHRLLNIQNKYPFATIHVIGHSYGTLLTYEAVRTSDIDTNRKQLKIGKFIIIGGILSELQKFKTTLQEEQIKEIHNFCSYKDWVVKFQPIFGRCGYFGFLKNKKDKQHYFKPHKSLDIKNYRFNLHHSDYFNEKPPNFFVMFSQILQRK